MLAGGDVSTSLRSSASKSPGHKATGSGLNTVRLSDFNKWGQTPLNREMQIRGQVHLLAL